MTVMNFTSVRVTSEFSVNIINVKKDKGDVHKPKGWTRGTSEPIKIF